MRFHFPVIIIDEDFRSENASGLGIRALAEAIKVEGFEVLGVTSYGDLTSFAQQQSRASAFILSIDDEEFTSDEAETTIAELRAFVTEIRCRNENIPIFLYGETRTSRHIPNDVLRVVGERAEERRRQRVEIGARLADDVPRDEFGRVLEHVDEAVQLAQHVVRDVARGARLAVQENRDVLVAAADFLYEGA